MPLFFIRNSVNKNFEEICFVKEENPVILLQNIHASREEIAVFAWKELWREYTDATQHVENCGGKHRRNTARGKLWREKTAATQHVENYGGQDTAST